MRFQKQLETRWRENGTFPDAYSTGSLQAKHQQIASNGVTLADIENCGYWHVEAKNVEKLNIWAALKQVEADCPDHRKPLVVFTRNRHATYVAMPLEVFEEMVKS